MAHLKFISDKDLLSIVTDLLEKADSALKSAEEKPGRNVIDPFSAIFELAGFNLSSEDWSRNERIRQAQKTLTNHIGLFHQKILGSVSDWENLGSGHIVDLVCMKRKIIAEVKNKFNTVSGGNLSDVYKNLQQQVMPKGQVYKDFTAYYVEIIPRKPERYDEPFIPSDKATGSKTAENKLLRRIDGYSFYEKVTGRKDALKELFDVLPSVITIASKKKHGINKNDNKILAEIFSKAYSPVE